MSKENSEGLESNEEEYEDESDNEKEIKINKEEIISQNSEKTELKEEPQKLVVMLIPKMKKELPLPLNTLFFFIELYSYENNLKKITDDNNNLVFYLMNIDWLEEFKSYYNYKCIEYIIHRELKVNKHFVNKIDNLINNSNPSIYYEDYKLVNKFNNIIINPKKRKKFGDKEEDFMPTKFQYDINKINKNIVSKKLERLESFKYFPKCVLINEKMRNVLYYISFIFEQIKKLYNLLSNKRCNIDYIC